MKMNVLVLPGDGIGTEVTREAVRVLQHVAAKFGHEVRLTEGLLGGVAIHKTGVPLPEETEKLAHACDATLLGAVGLPEFDDAPPQQRPEKGLLGGMTEAPTSDWIAGQDAKAALKQAPAIGGVARWHRKAGVVTHVFTHFPLELVVYTATVPARTKAPKGMRWVKIAALADEALPTVMRKVLAHGLGERESDV